VRGGYRDPNQNLLPFTFIEEVRALGIRIVGLPGGRPDRFRELPRRPDYRKVWVGGGGLHCSTAPLLRDRV
jgi:hypothetical protein